jgi:prepilin-type N-terminal cleavage/methylation domain-containing protein
MRLYRPDFRRAPSAFTLMEIAICLAIIGIALVGIIGVLPYGLNTQRDTREETIINQDVSTLLPILTQGSRGADDLTNYVYQIVNTQTKYFGGTTNIIVYTNTNNFPGLSPAGFLTNGANIVGLLSTPEYMDLSFNPTNNLFSGGYSNHIVAYVRSLSGLATEKPPQNNDLMLNDAFSYRIIVVNAPYAQDTNFFNLPPNEQGYARQIAVTQHELRMTFQWPQLPNGNVGGYRQTFRATVAGQFQFATNQSSGQILYFYQPQSFTGNPNLP